MEAFIPLRRRLMTHFDRVDTGEGYTSLHIFGVCTRTPLCGFSLEFRLLVSAVTGSDRTLAPGVEVVFEVVRMAVDEQFPPLMPTSYPGSMATDPKPYASLGRMWKAFGDDLSNNKTAAVNVEKQIFACFLVGRAVIRPVWAPARRSWVQPRPSAVSDAFMADGVEQSSDCHVCE